MKQTPKEPTNNITNSITNNTANNITNNNNKQTNKQTTTNKQTKAFWDRSAWPIEPGSFHSLFLIWYWNGTPLSNEAISLFVLQGNDYYSATSSSAAVSPWRSVKETGLLPVSLGLVKEIFSKGSNYISMFYSCVSESKLPSFIIGWKGGAPVTLLWA